MMPSGGSASQAAIIAAIQAQVDATELPGWPVFGLATAGQGWLSGVGASPEGVSCLRLDYREPAARELLVVQTQLDDGTLPVDLSGTVSAVRSEDGSGEPIRLARAAAAAGHLERVVVDGREAAARVHRSGEMSIWVIERDAVVVCVVARNVEVKTVVLEHVRDLSAFKERRREIVANMTSGGMPQ